MSDDWVTRGKLQNAIGSFERQFRAADDGSQVFIDREEELAVRGKIFTGTNAAFTMPVNAGTLATKCALYNPPGSGVFMKLMDAEFHAVVATTVVDEIGLYFSNGANATGATFTTAGVINNGRVGEGPAPAGQFWTVAVHVGTPVLLDIMGGWGAVTDGGATPIRKAWKSLLIPPSTLLSFAMTTAASTGSGITGQVRWGEIPYVAY